MAPFALQADPPSDIARAGLWAIGIIIPAVLTALLGYISIRKQKSSERYDEELVAFDRFRRDQRVELGITFGAFLDTIHSYDDAGFCQNLDLELQRYGALNAVPAKHRRSIITALASSRRDAVLRLLAAAFPEWKGDIDGILTPPAPAAPVLIGGPTNGR